MKVTKFDGILYPVLCITWLLGVIGNVNAQLIRADFFNYPDGQIVGAPGSLWVNNYEPSNQTAVVNGRLYLDQTNQESVRIEFPSQFNSGMVYARMTVNFSKLPEGNGNLFACFRGNNTDNLRGRIWATTNGVISGKFRLGISEAGEPTSFIARDLSLGSNYTVVCRYEVTNSFSTLWLDPADESDTTYRVDHGTNLDLWTIGQFAFLQTAWYQAGQGNYIGALTVDDLRIGRSFAEVLPLVKFLSITKSPSGFVGMSAIGQGSTNYVLQANTNLLTTNWSNLGASIADSDGLLNFTDPAATNFPSRFYRLMKQ